MSKGQEERDFRFYPRMTDRPTDRMLWPVAGCVGRLGCNVVILSELEYKQALPG